MANVVLFLDIVHAESRAVTKHKTLLEVYLKIIIIHDARLGFNSYHDYSLPVIRNKFIHTVNNSICERLIFEVMVIGQLH